jgi:hypothetical protein
MVVLSSALVIDYVCLVVGECEERWRESKRVNKKPVLQLDALARLDQ